MLLYLAIFLYGRQLFSNRGTRCLGTLRYAQHLWRGAESVCGESIDELGFCDCKGRGDDDSSRFARRSKAHLAKAQQRVQACGGRGCRIGNDLLPVCSCLNRQIKNSFNCSIQCMIQDSRKETSAAYPVPSSAKPGS